MKLGIVLAGLSPGKKLGSGGDGKVTMSTLNNFSVFVLFFFFQKDSNFYDITYLNFQINLKKENTAKFKLEKLYFSHGFPILISRQSFRYISVHEISLCSLASNAYQ